MSALRLATAEEAKAKSVSLTDDEAVKAIAAFGIELAERLPAGSRVRAALLRTSSLWLLGGYTLRRERR